MTHPAQRDAFETPHPQRQRAARFDVARPAGVSTAVVSYVLNGSPKKISPDTAQRVFDAAQWLDYHQLRRPSLKTGTTHTLGIIVPDFSNPYFAEFTDQLEAAASKRERALIINLSRGDPQGERRRINELVERNVDAMFVSSAQTDAELGALSGQSQRIILMDHPDPVPNMKCVSTDFRAAVGLTVQHLIEHGRTNTAMIYGSDPNSPDWRVQGWNQAFRQAGLPTGPIRRSRFTREGATKPPQRCWKATTRQTRSSRRRTLKHSEPCARFTNAACASPKTSRHHLRRHRRIPVCVAATDRHPAEHRRTRPLRGQRGARPRAHARRAAHRRRTRHQAVLRMQVTGRQVAANGSQ